MPRVRVAAALGVAYCLVIAVILSSLSACRMADKQSGEESAVASVPGAKSDPGATRDAAADAKQCDEPPEMLVCCPALTLECNECRAANQRAQREWDVTCLGKVAVRLECDKDPPVSSCCGDNTDACRECRELAFAALMEWRVRCGNLDALRCEVAPPQTPCCQSASPSCDACNVRNQRIREDWKIKCAR